MEQLSAKSYDNIKVRIVKNRDQLRTLIKYIKITGYCSFDFETNALPVEDDEFRPTIISISFQPWAKYVIPLAHFQSPFKDGEWFDLLSELDVEIFRNPKIIKLGHNLKFELRILMKYGMELHGKIFDSMLAKHLLDENTDNGLKDIVLRLFPRYGDYESELNELKKKHGGWANIPLKPLAAYGGLDADLTLQLCLLLERRFLRKDLHKLYALYRNLLMMNTRVLAETELMGMLIDRPYLKKVEKAQRKIIQNNLKEVMAHPKLEAFQKWRSRKHLDKLVAGVRKEIDIIEKEVKSGKITQKSASTKINNRLEKLSRYLAGELGNSKKELVPEFNLNSTRQLVDFLYLSEDGLQLPVVEYTKDNRTKKPTDNPSTGESALLKLKELDESGFIERLLTHREASKLHSTYMVGILEKIQKRTSRVHGRFLIHGTVTGRLSSREPNLQNIPRDTTSSLIKRAFIPPPGHLLVEIDYSQAELRLLAELSGDEAMIDIFKRGYNIHLATGLKINRVDLSKYDEANQVRKDPNHPDFKYWTKIHKSGKVMNFSIVYQQGDPKTAEDLGVSLDEAIAFKEEWYAQFPTIKTYLKAHVDSVYKTGYAENAFGRRRRLADIKLRKKAKYDRLAKGKYNKATRDAINAPIQGGSSDYAQTAAVEIYEKKLLGEKPFNLVAYQAYTVHDSIGFYIKVENIHKVVPHLIKVAEKPNTMKYFGFEFTKVKMGVSCEVGVNWGEKAEYNPFFNYKKLLNN